MPPSVALSSVMCSVIHILWSFFSYSSLVLGKSLIWKTLPSPMAVTSWLTSVANFPVGHSDRPRKDTKRSMSQHRSPSLLMSRRLKDNDVNACKRYVKRGRIGVGGVD